VSLVRYIDITSLDKPFLEAGQACKQTGDDDTAFVLLNRYIDIFYVIDDPSSNNIEEVEEFKITDIPSLYNLHLPPKNMIEEDEKEQISKWVLKKSVDRGDGIYLPRCKCPNCSREIYEGCLKCPFCETMFEPCVLTGYPTYMKNCHSCRSCGKKSIQEMFDTYILNFTYCAWCGNPP